MIFKTQNADLAPNPARASKQQAGSNVKFIDAIWDRPRVLAFIASADALISLHRAEEFGLTLAEAMLLGVPVVAMEWSGNLDFMDANTACLVPFTLTPVNDPQGIHSGQVWAEPDVGKTAPTGNGLETTPILRGLWLGVHAQKLSTS